MAKSSLSLVRRNSYLRQFWPYGALLVGACLLLVYHHAACPCAGTRGPYVRLQSRRDAHREQDRSVLWGISEEKEDEPDWIGPGDQDSITVKPVKKSHDEILLEADIRLIVTAVLKSAESELHPFTGRLSCQGDREENEVEDILCIPRPKFLDNVKNPCWWDHPAPGSKQEAIIRCLPKFHILGCEKCGSSDLWQRIASHPHTVKIQGTKQKEANWWGWQRFGIYGNRSVPIRNFTRYTDSFKPISRKIQKSLETNGKEHQYLITQDGTPSDFWDFRGWQNISQNRGLKSPKILTPHLMKHFYPNPKFIVIFRNPVERLYSDYYFASHGTNSTEFHKAVLKAIRLVASCLEVHSVRNCFFNWKLYASLPVRFHYLFYSIYLREWLKVFPRNNFLLLKTDDYESDPTKTLLTSFKFIGLPLLNQTMMDSILQLERFRVGLKKQAADEMQSDTRTILESIVRPCNRQLARLMKDDNFAWE